MILFEVNARGDVKSTPSFVPQGSALSDLVVITDVGYTLVTMDAIPPNGKYIQTIYFTPTQIDGKTLWQAIMPAELTGVVGNIKYQFFMYGHRAFTEVQEDGRADTVVEDFTFASEKGSINVQRGVIADMPDYVGDLSKYTIKSLHDFLGSIYSMLEGHDQTLYGGEGQVGLLEKFANRVRISEMNVLPPLWAKEDGDDGNPVWRTTVYATKYNTDYFSRKKIASFVIPVDSETKKEIEEAGVEIETSRAQDGADGSGSVFIGFKSKYRAPNKILKLPVISILEDTEASENASYAAFVGGVGGGKGNSDLYVGTGTPPPDAQIWINPEGDPAATEVWEFELESGDTETKSVVVLE